MHNPIDHFGLFLFAVWDHVFTLAAGCVVTVIINIIEKHWLKKTLPLKVDLLVLLSFFLFACFQAWHDQYQTTVDLQAKLNAQPQSSPQIQVNVPPSPPPQVVIAHDSSPDLNAVITTMQIAPMMGFNTIALGQKLDVQFLYKNTGTQTANNVLNTILVKVVDMSRPDAEKELKSYFDKGVKEKVDRVSVENQPIATTGAQESYLIFPKPTDPLSDAQVTGLESQKYRLYVLERSTWKDSHNRYGRHDTCMWLVSPGKGELQNLNMLWQNCGGNH